MSASRVLKPRLFKSMNYILDNRIVFPSNLKRITAIYNSYGGVENTISRNVVVKQFPAIEHFNQQTECKKIVVHRTSANAKFVIELDDGTQGLIRVTDKDTEQTIIDRIKQTAMNLTETQYEPELAIFIKDFERKVQQYQNKE
ncbi:hypothetical protein FDP41_000526 [Naegleria fowleri]|uniref:Ribosomal protein/NADH dehydrogenase domain-containing protein n=1 Tax=Naegleria fowleri TaxID=5763 RepID=A0A6A5C5S2_NAEFO|nr:uncharacterized protein FDP41_000526 [Naegleria fowleri]KAF0984627.1 hypothetical protein FDP41_000526 [Naegleria fowleri]